MCDWCSKVGPSFWEQAVEQISTGTSFSLFFFRVFVRFSFVARFSRFLDASDDRYIVGAMGDSGAIGDWKAIRFDRFK